MIERQAKETKYDQTNMVGNRIQDAWSRIEREAEFGLAMRKHAGPTLNENNRCIHPYDMERAEPTQISNYQYKVTPSLITEHRL